MTKQEIEKIILSYLNEEDDGEFLRYYTLNPVCLKPLIEELYEAGNQAQA